MADLTPPNWLKTHEDGDYCCTVTMQVLRPIVLSPSTQTLRLWVKKWHEALSLYYKISPDMADSYGPVYTHLKVIGESKYTVEIMDCEKILGGKEVLFSSVLNSAEAHECMVLLASTGAVRFYGESH